MSYGDDYPTVVVTALHEFLVWKGGCSDPECEDDGCAADNEYGPEAWADWFNPWSPYLYWSLDVPDDTFSYDSGEPVEIVLPLFEAAELVADWHGQVWDYKEGEYTCLDYGTGVEGMDTLFVEGANATAVFAIAETLA